MKNILFIGAGGFASECYWYLQDMIKDNPELCFKGCLAIENRLQPYQMEQWYLGHYDNYVFAETDYVVITIGLPHYRARCYEQLRARGVKFFTIIAPSAKVRNPQNIGESCVIAEFATVAGNAIIGNCNLINGYCSVGHDVKIGNYNVISSHSDITGFTQIGNRNLLGSRVTTLPHSCVGNRNKIAAGCVIYKSCEDGKVMHGNPAQMYGNNEEW